MLVNSEALERIREINRLKKRQPMFITAQHPGSGSRLAPNDETIRKVIGYGWWGQKKINGDSWQCHISSKGELVCYTRHGTKHTKKLHTAIHDDIVEHFRPSQGFTVLVGEWQYTLKKVFLFDILKQEGESFSNLTYSERYKILRDNLFITPNVEFLPVYRTVKQCLQVLEKAKGDKFLDGLVFKNANAQGWRNTSIVRCLKEG